MQLRQRQALRVHSTADLAVYSLANRPRLRLQRRSRIHDVISRQYVRVRTPEIGLAALQGHEETEYTVILRKRLAKRLVGRDIAIETGGEGQHHVVESFVGSDYAFQVRI